jgi:hypothetical protein
MEVISLVRRNGRERPRSPEGGMPVAVNLSCLTRSQRTIWDDLFPRLGQWTDGDICQATFLELWSFGFMCMLEGDDPNWHPELAKELSTYGRILKEYGENLRSAREGADTDG